MILANADALMWAQIIDKACVVIALILPLLIVLRWNLWGIIPGTLIFWGSVYIAGPLISELDSDRLQGGTAMLDVIWSAFGWLPAIVHCFLIYGMKCVFLFLWHRLRRTS